LGGIGRRLGLDWHGREGKAGQMLGQLFTSATTKTLAGILGISVAAGGLTQIVVKFNPAVPVIPSAVAAPHARAGSGLMLIPVAVPAAPGERPVVATTATSGQPAPKKSTPTKLAVASNPVAAPASSVAAGAACSSGITDSQIAKFRVQIAKVKAEHPELAAGIAKLTAQVDAISAGKVCEAELQKMFNSLCADPQVKAVLNAMMTKMSGFARMLVGDPCKKDIKTLLSLLDKMT